MWWGLSMEDGSKIPFSHAYFPYKYQLLRTFAGPLSCRSLQHLVHKISRLASGNHNNTGCEQAAVKIELVDHKSMWYLSPPWQYNNISFLLSSVYIENLSSLLLHNRATALNFPDWFFFASVLLFSASSFKGGFSSQFIIGSPEIDQLTREEVPYSAAAARFIAWTLNPTSKFYQDLLVDYLTKISVLWTSKKIKLDKSNNVSSSYMEVRKHSSDYQENRTSINCDGHTIWVWLKEFQDIYCRYCKALGSFAFCEMKTSQEDGSQQSWLFRKVPLGILIGSFDLIDEAGYELLLHYAATGAVFQFPGTQHVAVKHRRRNPGWQEVSIKWVETYTAKEAHEIEAWQIFDQVRQEASPTEN